ncbi:MAG TPA: ABC transporter ATP-binding protein [Gammaproteobacteria bacterium]|nr:ABC transporter ATP-binding protein [Gammaproteobacteria bacterium]
MSPVAIEVDGLSFGYAGRPLLQELSFRVAAGEIFGLVGADGAGKSTTLRLVIGQLPASAGELQVLGQAPSEPGLRSQLAYMPQGFGLYPDLSIHENLFFFADLHGLSTQAAERHIADLLQRTGLVGFEERRAGQLSGGMMQKLALACALVTEPRVMVLDEPTTGVDPVSRRAFWHLLEGVRAEGVAILYATANQQEAARCDRVGFLENGRLVRQGTPAELASLPDALLLRVTGPGARGLRKVLRELAEVRWVFPLGAQLHVWMQPHSDVATFRQHLARLAPGLRAEPIAPSLNDVALHNLSLASEGATP